MRSERSSTSIMSGSGGTGTASLPRSPGGNVLPADKSDRGCLGGIGGQVDDEPCPAAAGVVDPDLATVALDDVLGDGQAEPGSSGGRTPGIVETGEPLEDSLPVRDRYARAVVRDGHN